MSTILLNADSGSDIKLIAELAKKMNIDVLTLSKRELEEIEELKLLHIMRDAKGEGLADREQTLNKLGL
jgi:hypothetical protein